MSSGACILAHFADQEKLVSAAAKLSADKSITRWDAVDGHVQLVAWSPNSTLARESIARLDGVDQVTALEITPPIVPAQLDHSQCFAYVFIEIDKSKTATVSTALAGIPEVVSSSPARGGCDLVVLVGAETFSRVDRVIREQIRPLDGVLRLKQNRIIDLKQL